MVFYCRCFSFLLEEENEAAAEEEDINCETETPTRTSGTRYYSAFSEFSQSPPNSHARNLRVFTLAELKAATNNFSTKIKENEFGSVLKGVIKSLHYPFLDIHVVVKFTNELLQGHSGRTREINVRGSVEHPNLVKLIGYCEELVDCCILVYEYMVKGSVRDYLSARWVIMPWNIRVKVAQDVARAMAYLHEELDVEIVLRDFKPSNVLLDRQLNAKLLDFGLPQLHPQIRSSDYLTQEKGRGTQGYIAPESVKKGLHTSKSDVWSYGVFLYDLITGRGSLEMKRNKPKLLKWVKPYLGSKRFHQIVDPRLEGNYQLKSVQKLCIIANKCLSKNPKARPKMSEVLAMVNQVIKVPSQATSPASPQFQHVAVDPNKAIVGPIPR